MCIRDSSVGVIDWDRRLFDELIPLPDGTTYNAYLVKGSEKTALIDTVDPTKESELIDNLKELKIDRIDYVIANHAEQDHSGAIPGILNAYPNARVITNEKCKKFLMELLHIPEDRFKAIGDGDEISLGDKTLRLSSLHGFTGQKLWLHTSPKIKCFSVVIFLVHTLQHPHFLQRKEKSFWKVQRDTMLR